VEHKAPQVAVDTAEAALAAGNGAVQGHVTQQTYDTPATEQPEASEAPARAAVAVPASALVTAIADPKASREAMGAHMLVGAPELSEKTADSGGPGSGRGVLREDVRAWGEEEWGVRGPGDLLCRERQRWDAEKQRLKKREFVRLQLIFCVLCGASLVVIIVLGVALVVTSRS